MPLCASKADCVTSFCCGGGGDPGEVAVGADDRKFNYYRYSKYHQGDHLRIRLTKGELDAQVHALRDRLKVDDEFRQIFREQLRKATNWNERSSAENAKESQAELVQVRDQQNCLLNLRLLDEIKAGTFASKAKELRDREAELKIQIETADRNRHEIIDTAVKAFDISQSLREKWFAADFDAKRRILEILCLNWTLDGVTLVPEMRKPFDVLAEGLEIKNSRGDRRWAFPIEANGRALFHLAIAQSIKITEDAIRNA